MDTRRMPFSTVDKNKKPFEINDNNENDNSFPKALIYQIYCILHYS